VFRMRYELLTSNIIMSPLGLENKNHFAGEGWKRFKNQFSQSVV
jgi:hypothetical protein